MILSANYFLKTIVLIDCWGVLYLCIQSVKDDIEIQINTASEMLAQIKRACFKGVNLAKASLLFGVFSPEGCRFSIFQIQMEKADSNIMEGKLRKTAV